MTTKQLFEIGIEPNPKEKGWYEILIEGVNISNYYLYFDGRDWHIMDTLKDYKLFWLG
jgi:hypothetical protein